VKPDKWYDTAWGQGYIILAAIVVASIVYLLIHG
jgi:hypothetical protein